MLTKSLTNFFTAAGAEWVMMVLLALGLGVLWVVFDRWLFLYRHTVDIEELARELDAALATGDRERALAVANRKPSMEGQVMAAGIQAMDRGVESVEELVSARLVTARVDYDKHLSFLGTMGNNAPFIGLFGTVLGVIGAFDALETVKEGADRAGAIMGSIAEALVATAVGLLVAIPAVIAYNQFKGVIKARAARTEALSRVLIAHMKETRLAATPMTVAPMREASITENPGEGR